MKSPAKLRGIAFLAQVCFFLPALTQAWAETNSGDRYFDMDLAQLMQITITSVAKKPQTLADTAAAVFVITQEDIRRSGVTTVADALAMAPGMQVARISSSKWSVASRGFGGFTSNKLLVMIDGRSVYTPAYSGTYWDMQNTLLEDIDRIEVVRGPGGTMWGANAVNGVVNIITKKSQDTLGTLVRGGVGEGEKLSAAGRHGTTIGDSAFGRFYVTANDRDSNVLAGSDEDAHDGWHTVQGGFRMDGMVGSKSEWTLQGDLYRNNGDQIIFPYWLDRYPYLTSDDSDFTTKGANLIGKWQRRLDNDDLLTLKAYMDSNDREESYFEQNFLTLDADLQYETRIGERNSLTMGTGVRRIDARFEDTYNVSIPDQKRDLYNAFLQDEIELFSDRLWLTLGTKYEYNEYTGNEWQPSARLLWKPMVNHSLWTSVARAVRTPSMVEDSGAVTVASFPAPPFFTPQRIRLLGSSEFDCESLIAYEAGYRWQARENLGLDVAVYYNDYDDNYGILPRTDGSYDLSFANVATGEGHGVEIAVNWQARSWWALALSYSWQELSVDWKNSTPDSSFFNSEFYAGGSPRHLASLRSAIDFAKNWQFNCWLRYVDEIKGRDTVDLISSVDVPSYLVFDANLIWKPRKDLEVMLAGQNLFNSSQLEYAAELLTPITEIERRVYGKVTWRF